MGIWFDQKLRWRKHLSESSTKAKRLLFALKQAAYSKWGISHEGIKSLYLRAVRPIMLYGSLTWGASVRIESLMKYLDAVERLALLMCTNCIRTTSTDALRVIAGIPPIRLVIEERMVNHLLECNLA